MSYVKTGKFICQKCGEEIKRINKPLEWLEKWVCPNCGEVDKAYIE